MEKKFSKIKIFQQIGFVQGNYDDDLHRIRRQPVFYLRSLTACLLIVFVGIKIAVSSLFIDQESPVQFFIASWFNYLKPDGYHSARFYVGLCAIIAVLWFTILFIKFNYLNHAREDLFLMFMRLCNQIPYEKEDRPVGWPKEENDDYWRKDQAFCVVYSWIFNVSVVLIASIFNLSTFYINFELNPLIYAASMTLNVLHNTYFLLTFLQAILTLNMFVTSMINFFARKYAYISSQASQLKDDAKGFSNHKLNKLLHDFDAVSRELQLINQYVSQYIGINFVFFFFIGILITFVCLNLDLKLGVTLMLLIITAYGMIIYIPFERANKVLNEMNAASRVFQTISFNPKTDLSNKKKINYISFYTRDRTFGFTCFNLFTINGYLGITIGLQIISYIMMMLKVFRNSDGK